MRKMRTTIHLRTKVRVNEDQCRYLVEECTVVDEGLTHPDEHFVIVEVTDGGARLLSDEFDDPVKR
jgi:hypothetical protein